MVLLMSIFLFIASCRCFTFSDEVLGQSEDDARTRNGRRAGPAVDPVEFGLSRNLGQSRQSGSRLAGRSNKRREAALQRGVPGCLRAQGFPTA